MTDHNLGYSTLWWAAVLGLILAPMAGLAIDVGRYAYARGEIYKAADAGALAGAQMVDIPLYEFTGILEFSPDAPGVAQAYVDRNTSYLGSRGIHPSITGMWIDQANKTVHVEVSADISRLFPQVVPSVIIHGHGIAQVRGLGP